jgi:hypothetical protein
MFFKKPITNWLSPLIFIGAIIIGIWAFSGRMPKDAGNYGIYSLLPAAITLLLCFITKNVIFALITGVAVGGVITGEYNILNAYLFPSLGSLE